MRRHPAERLAALLLWLYPPSFRRSCGADVRQFVRTAAADGADRHLVRTVAIDAVRSLAREWRATLTASSPHTAPWQPRPGEPMRNIVRDVTLAMRVLVKSPAFTIASVLTLALGIGANTAMITLADATLLRPLRVHAPERLVVWSWSSSYPDYREYAKRTDLFEGVLAAGGTTRVNLAVDGSADLAWAGFLSGNAFSVLGVPAAHGRTLLPSDDVANAPLVAVLSHDYWRARFGGDPAVVGRALRINGRPLTIVGVAAEGFRGTALHATPSLYLPTAVSSTVRSGFFSRIDPLTTRGFVWLSVIGRLKDGVPVEQATAAMDTMYAQLQPPREGREREVLRLDPLQTRALGSGAADVRTFVVLLLGVVGLTLLIGCANLANLLLAKGAARRREIGVRLALGATRGRVVRQMLTESVLLAAIGGAAGIAVAALALQMLSRFQLPGALPIENLALSINGPALAVTFGLSLLTGLLFGAMPAWRASRTDVLVSLRDQSRGATSRAGARGILLAAQVALSLVLLAGTGLFARSLAAALDRPLGFDVRNVMTATVNLGLAQYDKPRALAFYDQALDRVRRLPEVEAAAWSTVIPTRGLRMSDATVTGYPMAPDEDLSVYLTHVTSDFFTAIGTRVVAGRPFGPQDAPGTPPVGIINEAMAKKYWAGRNPIGGTISLFENAVVTIVGVAENTVVRGIAEGAEPQLYLSLDQSTAGADRIATEAMHLFVRTRGEVTAAMPAVREQLRGIERELPLYDVESFEARMQTLVMPQRMGALLLGLFSVLALALATVGIYGVATFVASLRTREIGVRMALGATAGGVRRLMLRQGAAPIVAGLIVGIALALYASRLARAFLFEVSPFDPLAFGAATAVLAVVALAASYLPAWRASRIEPVTALRDE